MMNITSRAILASTVLATCASLSAHAAVVDISGAVPSHFNTAVGVGNSARLVGDAVTWWNGGTYNQDVDMNGFTFEINTGGGNNQTYGGAITGPGNLVFNGRSNIDDAGFNDGTLAGSVANTMDSFEIQRGTINLDKTAGVDALAGSITATSTVIGWVAEISLRQSNQINDLSTIDSTLSTQLFVLEMNDNSETFAGLTIKDGDYVETDGDKTESDGSSAVLTLSSLTVGGVSYGPGTYTSGDSSFVTGGGSVTVIPEPGSLALLGLGGLALAGRRRRK